MNSSTLNAASSIAARLERLPLGGFTSGSLRWMSLGTFLIGALRGCRRLRCGYGDRGAGAHRLREKQRKQKGTIFGEIGGHGNLQGSGNLGGSGILAARTSALLNRESMPAWQGHRQEEPVEESLGPAPLFRYGLHVIPCCPATKKNA